MAAREHSLRGAGLSCGGLPTASGYSSTALCVRVARPATHSQNVSVSSSEVERPIRRYLLTLPPPPFSFLFRSRNCHPDCQIPPYNRPPPSICVLSFQLYLVSRFVIIVFLRKCDCFELFYAFLRYREGDTDITRSVFSRTKIDGYGPCPAPSFHRLEHLSSEKQGKSPKWMQFPTFSTYINNVVLFMILKSSQSNFGELSPNFLNWGLLS